MLCYTELCHSDLWAVLVLSEILSPSSALYEDNRFYKNVNQYPQFYKVLQIINITNISEVPLKQGKHETVRLHIGISYKIL